MYSQISSSFQGEESQIRELLQVFKDTIMKTGQDTIMLQSKFDSDLKQKLKPKLTKHMKNLVELDERLSNEKEAASQANNDISEAYRAYNDRPALAYEDDEDPLPEEPVEFDDNGQPVYSWPPAGWNDNPERQHLLRILDDDNFDIFFDRLIKIKDRQKKNKSDPRIKSLKNLLAQQENNDDVEDEDDEPIASVVESIPIDPITKKKIRFPVKNVKCGHIYDKESIDSYMKSNNPRCPYIGCVNRAPIRPDDVVNDIETRSKIEYLMALEDNESDDE